MHPRADCGSFATHRSAGDLGGDVGELGLKVLALRVLAKSLRSRHADLCLGLLLESGESVDAGRLLLGARWVAQRGAVSCSSCLLVVVRPLIAHRYPGKRRCRKAGKERRLRRRGRRHHLMSAESAHSPSAQGGTHQEWPSRGQGSRQWGRRTWWSGGRADVDELQQCQCSCVER